MTDEVFRIIIAVAVGLACIMVIVQAFVMVGLLKIAKKIEQRVEPLANRAEPVLDNLKALTAKLQPVIEEATPVVGRLGPVVEKIGVTIDKIGPLVERIEAAADQANKILITGNRIVEDVRPRIVEVSGQVAAISHTGREQVERFGELLQDASTRARSRLDQIDQTVENTVEQVEQVGDAVKRTVMRPVREVNGIAAGISAAVSSLVGKPRKYSVDSATQDEEMFI